MGRDMNKVRRDRGGKKKKKHKTDLRTLTLVLVFDYFFFLVFPRYEQEFCTYKC